MERILKNYDFLLQLAQTKTQDQKQLLDGATSEEILAVIDCIKFCEERLPKTLGVYKRQKRWRRAVSLLKRNSKLLTPALVTALCTILREALFYIYNME